MYLGWSLTKCVNQKSKKAAIGKHSFNIDMGKLQNIFSQKLEILLNPN